jgi:hypothetical protein
MASARTHVQSQDERKTSSSTPQRYEVDFPSELLDDLPGNVQSKPDSFGVDLFGRLQEPEQLKQFVFILVLDTDARVRNSHLDHSVPGSFEALVVIQEL